MDKVSKFLDGGHKVKITIFYRGREQAHKEIGFKLADKVISDFGDRIAVDQNPQLTGKQLNFVVRASATRLSAVAKATTAKPKAEPINKDAEIVEIKEKTNA